MPNTAEKNLSPRKTYLYFLLLCAGLAGCERAQSQQPPAMKPPEVLISLPVTQEVTDYEDFAGRTEAVSTIEIRARVTGYLDKVCFDGKEGADVKKGDVLAEIDPRPYRAELARTEANVVQAQAHLKRLELDYNRATKVRSRGAMSQEEYDKICGDRAEASAAVGVAEASRDNAKLNLEFTQVKAPIDGRISRRLVDPGNLVKADETMLTTIVSLDPMYAYFDVDERTVLRIRRLLREWQTKLSSAAVPVMLRLADEDEFTHQGTINFVDNKVDTNTGSMWLRGLFTNPKQDLSPGLFVYVRLPVGTPRKCILMAEQALGRDQAQKFVYVINDKDEVLYRPVKIGRLENGLRVITEGLAMGEKVVVSGLQRIRPGIKVEPKLVDMPKLVAASTK
jgi:RND family efflux transporter MFP subunit